MFKSPLTYLQYEKRHERGCSQLDISNLVGTLIGVVDAQLFMWLITFTIIYKKIDAKFCLFEVLDVLFDEWLIPIFFLNTIPKFIYPKFETILFMSFLMFI